MHIRKKKLVCFMLMIFVFLSGMYFENVKTDFSVVCASNETTNSYIMSYDAVIMEAEHCTTEMMGIRNSIGIKQFVSRYITHKRDSRNPLDFLCSNSFCLSEGRSFTRFETTCFLNQYQEEFVLNYIHKSDGKKRV
ncbi:MAG: hypothetical protein IJA36_12675 [Lachnospiraceae bacterium]|nr:hypothetical protein [Lachnospiraceae bacterium]